MEITNTTKWYCGCGYGTTHHDDAVRHVLATRHEVHVHGTIRPVVKQTKARPRDQRRPRELPVIGGPNSDLTWDDGEERS